MSLRLSRPLTLGQPILKARTLQLAPTAYHRLALSQTHYRPKPDQQNRSRQFSSTPLRSYEMSQGSHPHLKIAELFDVSDLTVAVTVSNSPPLS